MCMQADGSVRIFLCDFKEYKLRNIFLYFLKPCVSIQELLTAWKITWVLTADGNEKKNVLFIRGFQGTANCMKNNLFADSGLEHTQSLAIFHILCTLHTFSYVQQMVKLFAQLKKFTVKKSV